jgi:RNA polymerase sigma-70 factor (sigma-E family)
MSAIEGLDVGVTQRRWTGRGVGRGVEGEADLAEVYASAYRRMVRLAAFLLGSAADAEDVAQDAFVKLAGRRLEDPDKTIGYLQRTVVNACKDASRRRRVIDSHAHAIGPVLTAPSAEEQARATFDRTELVVALRDMAPRRRQVVVLRHYCDMSEAAVADLLGISIGAVKSLTSRGLAEMAERLEDKR